MAFRSRIFTLDKYLRFLMELESGNLNFVLRMQDLIPDFHLADNAVAIYAQQSRLSPQKVYLKAAGWNTEILTDPLWKQCDSNRISLLRIEYNGIQLCVRPRTGNPRVSTSKGRLQAGDSVKQLVLEKMNCFNEADLTF